MDNNSNATAGGAVSVDIRGGRSLRASAPAASPPPPGTAGRKRRAVARGVQSALSKTSSLANFLPTGTLLTFEVSLPAASGDGSCSAVSAAMIRALLALCAASCFLFHFTDSFRAPDDGKVYYGFVTPRGLSLFRTGLGVEVPREDRYRLAFVDVVHAAMSVLVFAAVALADYRVSGCLFPGHRKEMDEVMESLPLMVGAVCSGLFLVFPNTRYGVGCLAA
ncbi:unnamed protein product [Urochloa decumbens]|uniref:Uncharacterized protein n=1 Tax=Urochloa decumbens TaxID=240449 RepID=A0ABC9DR94_9POAL